MKGKVVSYDPIKGIGKILIEKKGVKLFNIDNWLDYNTLPEIGLEIEFELENNEIKNILSIDSVNELFDKLNEKFTYTFPADLTIQEDTKLTSCMEDFFSKYRKIAFKYKEITKSKKTLPYKKIKRFLFTAYNNLLEIDSNINDDRLREVKANLDEVEYYYDKLKMETKNPTYVLLEKLVLSKQKTYQLAKTKFETNKTLITENTTNANMLELKIDRLKNELSKLKKKSKEYEEKLNKLKTYKRRYVDLIDDTQNLKEENSAMLDNIKEFEKVYESIFEKVFNKEVYILLKLFEKEMDILAHQFDTILWENAKNSLEVHKFFEEAKIEGSYSTKTFMKYYLKTLKNDKMHERDAELVEIFNELKAFSKKIIVFDKNYNQARDIVLYIENIDHDSDVEVFDNLKEFIFYIKEHDSDIDIVIIDMDETIKLLMSKVLPILERIGAKIITFSDKSFLFRELKEVI